MYQTSQIYFDGDTFCQLANIGRIDGSRNILYFAVWVSIVVCYIICIL